MTVPPLLRPKDHAAPSVFTAAALLRESRRQKGLAPEAVPAVCLLDPDGDIVRRLRAAGRAAPFAGWACYHTELDVIDVAGREIGVIGRAVGAPFAVLVAEQLFASGCRLLVSLTSAGALASAAEAPCFVVIDRALRDEGVSCHYAPPADYAEADLALAAAAGAALDGLALRTIVGGAWTTDAPFRETAAAVADAQARGLLVVEMEAAGLYAFAQATGARVLCLAHVTNAMGRQGDFEKGEADGVHDALAIVGAVIGALEP